MRQSNRMKRSISSGKPGRDFHAENMFRRPRRNQKNSNSVLNDKSLRPRGKVIISKAAKSSFVPKYRNRLSSIVTQKLLRANLLQEVGSDLSLKQSSSVRERQKGADSLTNGNISPKRADRTSKISCSDGVQVKRKVIKGNETDGISESSLSESPGKPSKKPVGDDMSRRPINHNLLSYSSDNEADQSSDASVPDCAERNSSQRKDANDEKCLKLNSPTSWKSIGEEIAKPETQNEHLDNQYSAEHLPDDIAFDKKDLDANYDTVKDLVEVINTFENFNITLPTKTFVYRASVKRCDSHKKEKEPFDENKSNLENIVTAKLMGDIDLHLELENYLKAISTSDETGSGCKVRTKNTLQQNHVNCGRGENTDFEGSGIVDKKLGENVSAGELNFSEISENTNEKEKSKMEDSVSGWLINEAKAKSSSSFKSAVSVCTPPSPTRDRNLENQFFVFLDRKIENFPVSLENMDSKPTKDCASYTFPQVLEESKNVKKIRSENDASVLQHEMISKGHIKRTVGEISFQPPERNTTPPVLEGVKTHNSHPVPLLKGIQGEPQINIYEKISPVNPCCEGKSKPNSKDSVLFKNSFYSTSADSLKRYLTNIECVSVELCNRVPSKHKFDNHMEGQEQSESLSSEKLKLDNSLDESLKSRLSSITLNSNSENWSPSLQELIEIYSSVLKQNKKIRRSNLKRVKRCISSYLISFIRDKIKEKMHRKELINYAKERMCDSKLNMEEISNIYAGESKNSEKNNFSQLVEYVNRFREVLTSSLSINQITQLNNIMAGLQDSSVENSTPTKIVNKKNTPIINSVVSEKESSKRSVVSSLSKQKNLKSDRGGKKTKDVRETISFRTNKLPKRSGFKTTANDKLKSVKEVEVPPSAELESVLKSYLTKSEKTVRRNSQVGRSVGKSCERKDKKFLVNVKLCENKIIVKGMRQFQNEKAISKSPISAGKETSDLIIERVSDNQMGKLNRSSKGKPSKSVSLNENMNNSKKKVRKEVKTSKQGAHRFKTGGKHTKTKSEEIVSKVNRIASKGSISRVLIQGVSSMDNTSLDEEPYIHKFEYNHHQLKVQHPIEAIIESSESKTSERTVNNYSEVLLTQEESKFHVEGEVEKDEKDVLSDSDINVLKSLTKSLIFSNVGSGEEPRIPLQRAQLTECCNRKTGSLLDLEKKLPRKKVAKFTKPPNTTNTCSLQSSKKSAPKTKKLKISLSRPRSTYLCYPYLQCIQGDKTTKSKKGRKSRKLEDGSASSSHEETVLKVDSSRKGQNKTKVLKSISKGLSNIFKKASERREKFKISNSGAETVLGKKQENSKTLEDVSDHEVSDSQVEEDDQSTELISFSINGFSNGSSFVVHNRSFVSLTSSEKSAQEPRNLESYKHFPSGSPICASRLKKRNLEEDFDENQYCNCGVEEDGECSSARVKRSFASQNSSGSTGSHKRPTITIHARKEGNDDVSFPSLMVLSESFLKCYSHFALSRTKIKSLFKSRSDLQFYPGRVVDNPEEQTPFVTFVLTPKQRDEAGLPEIQTKIVTKPRASEENLEKGIREEDFHVNFEQTTHENSLRAIELFIETLSESRKRACKLKAQNTGTKETTQKGPRKSFVSASKPCPKRYKFTPCRRLQALFASKRKAYHECQKRLLPNKIENSKKGSCRKNAVSEKKKICKPRNTMKVAQISSENTTQSQKNELENPRKNKNHKNTEMTNVEVHEEKNIEDNLTLTATRSCYSCQNEPNDVSNDNTLNDEQNEVNLLLEYIEQFQNVKKTMESFENKEGEIEATDEHQKCVVSDTDSDVMERDQRLCKSEHDSERKMQMTKNAKKISSIGNVRNCKSADSSEKQTKGTNDRKELKTVKIKVHSSQSKSNKSETVDENSHTSFGEGTESLGNPTWEKSPQISDGERELLDLLVLEEEKPGNLERKFSTYFDAGESEREETNERCSQDLSFTKSLRMNPSGMQRDPVPLAKKKGEDLMTDNADNRWQRILSILDDVSQEIEKSSEEESDEEQDKEGTAETTAMILNSKKSEQKISDVFNFLKKHTLDRTKTFWNKVTTISSIIDEGRESVQSTSFPSRNLFHTVEGFRVKSEQIKYILTTLLNFYEVFSKLVEYLNAFKIKFNVEPEKVETERKDDDAKPDTRFSSNWREFPVALYQSKSENFCGTNSSDFLIHQTNNMFNIPEALSEFPLKGDESKDLNSPQVLPLLQ